MGNKLNRFLTKIDIFTYIPVPHTFPVSSSKSKAASILFIMGILGFFIYDLVSFILFNAPVINSFTDSTPLGEEYDLPEIAFGFFYGEDLDQTLNDPTYFSYQFLTIQTQYENNELVSEKKSVGIKFNCSLPWLQSYSDFYKNLSCLDASLILMNPPLKRPESIMQRLVISLCSVESGQACRSEQEMFEMLGGGRLFFFINEPQGFNYKTGTIVESQYPFQILTFFFVPGIYNRVEIQFQRFKFKSFPNYLTTFTTSNQAYMKSKPPLATISNVSVYNENLMMSISMSISAQTLNFDINFETILEHLSLWGAMTSVSFTILTVCLLAYNRRKFLRKNPDWGTFDQTLKKKFDLQLEQKESESEKES